MPILVKFHDSMPSEVEPSELLVRARIPALIEFKVAFPTFDECFRPLTELLSLVGVYSVDKLLQMHPLVGQYVAVVIGHPVVMDIILHHDETTHVEGL